MSISTSRRNCPAPIFMCGQRPERPSALNVLQALMRVGRVVLLGTAMLAGSTFACSAGPCTAEIAAMQARLDARLGAAARSGPSAPESPAALAHRQPTPGSIAAAERKLGELSPEKGQLIRQAMEKARAADQAGDKAACEQALDQVERAIGP